jgi:hypothetical protein
VEGAGIQAALTVGGGGTGAGEQGRGGTSEGDQEPAAGVEDWSAAEIKR